MRIEQLTFTRFVAAISIVIYHYGSGSTLFNNEYISFIFTQANIGVSYFYILSGFVMVIAYSNKGKIFFWEYIKNRLARIYPLYLLAIVLILGVSMFKNFKGGDFILNVLMLQSWFPDKALTINIPGWSLSVELFFYVTFPLFMNQIYRKVSLRNLTIWIVLFWLVSQLIFHMIMYNVIELSIYNSKDMFYYPLMHFNKFLTGSLAGLYFVEKRFNSKNYYFHIFVLLCILMIFLKFPFGLNYHNGLLAILFIPLILFISLSNDFFTKLMTKKEFVFLGEISFGIYILQASVWIIFSDYRMEKYLGLDKELNFTRSFFIRLMILIILSSFSYLYFENPIRNKIKKLYLKTYNY